MSEFLTDAELDGLREDMNSLFGINLNEDESNTKCRIYLPGDATGVDQNGNITYASDTVIYQGACLLRPIIYRRGQSRDVGGILVTDRSYRIFVPWNAGNIKLIHKVDITESRDLEAVNRTFDISDVLYEDGLSIRRITVIDNTIDYSDNC